MTRSLNIGLWAVCVCLGWTQPVHANVVTDWNATTLSCVQGPPNPPNRGGPVGLLDIALVQVAMHDAVQAIEGKFQPYHYSDPSRLGKGTTATPTPPGTPPGRRT